ncbi:hypothetical protein GCM10017673_55780 [Streptosporangium violaceochromogenes]|nr:hypothetical protein GCM10017673_55780 [Streptosporangium violaceochromogenes]
MRADEGNQTPDLLLTRFPKDRRDRSEPFTVLITGTPAVQIRPTQFMIACSDGSQSGSRSRIDDVPSTGP